MCVTVGLKQYYGKIPANPEAALNVCAPKEPPQKPLNAVDLVRD